MRRELSLTAFRAVLDSLRNKPTAAFHDVVGGGHKWTGEFTFKLIDAETGVVEQRRVTNSTVDEGENALLQFVGGITDNQVVEFDGDGSQTSFDIPYPYHPIRTVNDVSVGGTSQSVPADYAVDYFAGTLMFDSAPSAGTNNVDIDLDYYTKPWEWLAVGTDSTSVAEGDTSLGSESARVVLDSGYYTRDEGAVEITGQWTLGTGQANVTIAEAGLFNVPSSAPVNGDMLNRTVVSPAIDKNSSQELQVTWTLSMA